MTTMIARRSGRGALAAVLVFAVLAGCSGEEDARDGGDGGMTGSDAAVAPSMCCPIFDFPTCGCLQVGGTRSEAGACPAICDAVPVVVKRFTDQNGCPAVELSAESCFTPRGDAAIDGAVDGSGGTAPDSADAAPDVTADVGVDGPATVDAVDALSMCCPIFDFPTCGCLGVGGTRSEAGVCTRICDAVPVVVRRFTDQNGCPAVELSADSCLNRGDAAARD